MCLSFNPSTCLGYVFACVQLNLDGGASPPLLSSSDRHSPVSTPSSQLKAAMGHNFLFTCFTSSMPMSPICSAVPISLTNFMNSAKIPGRVR